MPTDYDRIRTALAEAARDSATVHASLSHYEANGVDPETALVEIVNVLVKMNRNLLARELDRVYRQEGLIELADGFRGLSGTPIAPTDDNRPPDPRESCSPNRATTARN